MEKQVLPSKKKREIKQLNFFFYNGYTQQACFEKLECSMGCHCFYGFIL